MEANLFWPTPGPRSYTVTAWMQFVPHPQVPAGSRLPIFRLGDPSSGGGIELSFQFLADNASQVAFHVRHVAQGPRAAVREEQRDVVSGAGSPSTGPGRHERNGWHLVTLTQTKRYLHRALLKVTLDGNSCIEAAITFPDFGQGTQVGSKLATLTLPLSPISPITPPSPSHGAS